MLFHSAAAPSDGIRRNISPHEEEPSISGRDARAWIAAPLTTGQRRAWRDKIGGCWKWSEALPGRLTLKVLSHSQTTIYEQHNATDSGWISRRKVSHPLRALLTLSPPHECALCLEQARNESMFSNCNDYMSNAELLALWGAHGTGLVAKHSILYFQDGALTAPSPAAHPHGASHACGLVLSPDHYHYMRSTSCGP